MTSQAAATKTKKAPLGDVNANAAPEAPAGSKKSVEQIYQKKTQLEHILLRPDTYVGSCEKTEALAWVYDKATDRLVQRQMSFVPGLYKIFDEILVNATDNKVRDPTMVTLKVDIDAAEGVVRVFNDGNGIPVEMHKEEGVYVPELIFGHLLTSSNYDDGEKKVTGGRNGYGAKLANIFSSEFVIETCDGSRERRYRQVFRNNMSEKSAPVVTKCKPKDNWTCITFKPDLAKFNMTELEEDTVALMCKRVYDAAGNIGKNTKIFLNGERLKVKGFSDYVDLYLDGRENAPKIYEKVNDRWEVCVTISDSGQFQQCSFVNGICTMKGGTHVNAVADEVASKLLEKIKKKEKSCKNLKAPHVKNHLWVFVNALIENPAFDSQTKETLNTRASNFGSKYTASDACIKKVMSSGVVEQILSWASFKQSKELKKQDGAKKTRLTGIPKLDDANDAGGRNSEHCTLILTEGDSAKALAVSGLSVVGRDRYGVFPLRGKLLNVRDASHDQIMNNAEISYIKQILGLRHGTAYDSVKSLRYGHIMIMTDQDHDGSHIKGLLINFLHAHFPTLLKIPGFLVEFITPIIKATKGKQAQVFYTLPEYDNWKAANDGATRGWHIKYYKGLGTSTAKEAKEYFAELDHHRKTFAWSTDGDGDLIDMAFSKKRVEDRKRWLTAYEPGTFLDMTADDVKYDDFVNKELILFSRADLMRSIPSVVDGFKPSQRKVLFSCFKRKLRQDIKVAQLSGYVSEHSAYHHGEASLASTIVGLAQDFVGSNNINLLVPSGQFGTRLQGGKDHASPRYIFTRLAPICRAIFPECDDALLDYLDEDGQVIEPEHYLPILPLVLVNGADGIGTGWSTSIPNYNPRDIVANIRATLSGEETTRMHPWYKNFEGSVVEEIVKGEIRYSVVGKYEIKDETTLEISELPLRSWTTDYKDFLENLMAPKEKNAQPFITDYKEHHTDATVHFVVKMTPEKMEQARKEGIEKKFKLISKVSTSNMHCFNAQGVIQKYQSPEAMMEAFVPLRLAAYERRRQMLLRQAESELKRMRNKTRFILAVVDGELSIGRKKKSVLVEELETLGFDKMPKTQKVAAAAAQEAMDGENGENEDASEAVGASFDYLLSMPLWNLTQEKVDELCAEREVKTAEVTALHATTDKQLWLRDLDAFDDAMDVFDAENAAAADELRRQQNAAKRNATKAGKKALAKKKKKAKKGWNSDESESDEEDEDFSDDEFMPAPKKRAAPKPKPAAAKPAAAKPAAAKPAAAPAAAAPEPVAPPPPADVDSDEDEFAPKLSLAERLLARQGAPAAKPKAAAPKKAAAQPAAPAPPAPAEVVELDASDDASKPAPAAKKAAPPAKKAGGPAKKAAVAAVAAKAAYDFDASDEEEEVELSEPVAPRAASSRRGGATRKVYKEESSEEEESDFEDDEEDSDFE